MNITEYMKEHILVFDGGMGTVLQQTGLEIGGVPDLLNLSNPDWIREVHRKYVEAGCDVVTTNTFGTNRYKLKDQSIAEVIKAAVANARAAEPKFVALDIGPIGGLLQPMGNVSWQQAYDLFAEQIRAGKEAGVDVILFETISDLMELKVGILAAKETCDLPIFCTMTYQEDGRTFVGTDPVSATVTLNGLGVAAQGVNCSLGPKELLPVVQTILDYATTPVMVQPNAGLPDMKGEYHVSPQEYVATLETMAQQGVNVVGGCCGTAPEFIRQLKEAVAELPVQPPRGKRITAVASGSKTAILSQGISVIGERINPTGKPKLKEALRNQNMEYLLREAIAQAGAGADVLDVNVGLPEIDEVALLERAVGGIQSVTNLPLQIDSSDPKAIEAAARCYNGKPLINSVNGKQESLEAILPIAKKYGACVLGLCLNEQGIPATAQGRLAIAEKIVRTAGEYGIPKENVLIDTLVLTASAQQEQVSETLKAIRLVKEKLGVACVLGVSNVSFGLPNRPLLNSTFLAAGFGAGLNAPIMNPLSAPMMDAVNAFRVLNNQDVGGNDFIAHYAQTEGTAPAQQGGSDDLKTIILQGRKEEAAGAVERLLQTKQPLEIIDNYFVPALNIVGERFAKQQLFLPQLMQSAETVKKGFEQLEGKGEKQARKGKIVLATVQGDIHDIGKNIVKMMLQNYGYEVIDLGKDVPIEEVVYAARDVKLVGLSALMTTTVNNMEKTIQAIHQAGLPCKVMVGGAVLSKNYAEMVGADYYARDAQQSVKIANEVFSG